MSALDFGARALITRQAADLAIGARRDRLRRLMAMAAGANASDLPALSPQPTIACTGNTPTAGLTSVLNVTGNPELFTLYGGVPARNNAGQLYGGSYWRCRSVTVPTAGNAGVGNGAEGVGMRVAFRTDALMFDVLMLGQLPTSRVRVLIDGVFADKVGIAMATSSGSNTVNVAMPGGSQRRLRRIDVEYEKDGGFYGLRVAPGDMVQPVAATDRYRIALIGDSISASIGADRVGNGWAFHAGRRLGNMNVDIVSMAIGGTGLVNPGSAWRFIDHVDDLLLQPIDEVWIAGGANDQGYAASDLTAAAIALGRAVRLRCPDRPIIQFGSFIGGGHNAEALATETAIAAGFAQWADSLSAFVPFNMVVPPLQTGNAAAPTSGNYQYYGQGSIDTTHPSSAGHDYIGAYVAEARRRLTL